MRLLAADKQEVLLGSVRLVLHASPFRFQDDWAAVIPGAAEAVYDWLSVNVAACHLYFF